MTHNFPVLSSWHKTSYIHKLLHQVFNEIIPETLIFNPINHPWSIKLLLFLRVNKFHDHRTVDRGNEYCKGPPSETGF